MTVKTSLPQVDASIERKVLTSATLKAAELLGITHGNLAKIIGVSPATISRMSKAAYLLDHSRKEWELALLFVRLFRALDSITAGRAEDAKVWLFSHNRALAGLPAEMLGNVLGLISVVDYLDSVRGRV